jgi:hypothetical protein
LGHYRARAEKRDTAKIAVSRLSMQRARQDSNL